MAHTLVEGLTKAQLEKFRETLVAKADGLRENLMAAKAGQALRGERLADVDDQAVQSHEEWIFLNRNNIDVMLLREINEALARVEDGTFGECMECEDPISIKRLEAIPWAKYCIGCQEEISAREEEDKAKAERRR
jgi:DnaK suppressor protein